MAEHGPFDVGDEVLYGKYKNKVARIAGFGLNPKGQETVELEPVPKGRKKNKVLGLYKIWTKGQVREFAMGGENRCRRLIEEIYEGMAAFGILEEAIPTRSKRRAAGAGAHRMTRTCPPGTHMKDGRCQRIPLGQLRKAARVKKRWRRTGAGKKSDFRSTRFAKRFG